MSGFVARCEPMLGCVGGQFSECAPGYEAAYCAECSRGYACFLTLLLAARGYPTMAGCRYFRLNGQCLRCNKRTAKIVQNANLVFIVSMTIAMTLFPMAFLATWCVCYCAELLRKVPCERGSGTRYLSEWAL